MFMQFVHKSPPRPAAAATLYLLRHRRQEFIGAAKKSQFEMCSE